MNKIDKKILDLESELELKNLEIQQIKEMAIADVTTKETIKEKLDSQ